MTDLAAFSSADPSLIFIELGILVIGLAILTRFAARLGLSAIPLYLLAGLAFGNGGILPLRFTQEFVQVGAEIGSVLLLFMLGLEYTGEELSAGLRSGLAAGLVDLLLNFTPGMVAGLLLGWPWFAALLLGGITYISSSGIIARVLSELGQMGNPEVPVILTILVIEDLAMAVFLPFTAVILIGQSLGQAAISVVVALGTVALVLFAAARYGAAVSRVVSRQSDEIILYTTFGLVLLVAGLAQRLQISAGVGAFLVGVALSGPIVQKTHHLLSPLRDLFAAIFFLFFGLQVDPASLLPAIAPAVALGVVTALTKFGTGWWAARRSNIQVPGRVRAGLSLIARGEFSILIAGLGVALEPRLGPLSAAYVLLLAVAGPLLLKIVEPLLKTAPVTAPKDPS